MTPKDVEGFDAVVHLAELSNDPLSELNERTTYEINHLGSVTLARACKAAGVPRFVYTSSCSVYGAAEDAGERSEQSAPNPQTAYARCKVLVERMSAHSLMPILRPCSCATLRHSAPALACGSTLFSTTSPGSPGPLKRSG
jgi:nucleoside-diphosphate-sugar epimerase